MKPFETKEAAAYWGNGGVIAEDINGGQWSGGRHTRGSGYGKDCEKYNEAGFDGWTVFRLTGDMITVPNLERIIRHVRMREVAR